MLSATAPASAGPEGRLTRTPSGVPRTPASRAQRLEDVALALARKIAHVHFEPCGSGHLVHGLAAVDAMHARGAAAQERVLARRAIAFQPRRDAGRARNGIVAQLRHRAV